MGGIGWQELLIVLVIVVIVFGAGRLPQIGEGLGKAIRNLKRGVTAADDEVEAVKGELEKSADG